MLTNILRKHAALLSIASLLMSSCAPPQTATIAQSPEKTSPNAIVIGTAHKGHPLVADYPMTKLADVLTSYMPDLVLVEIRPEAFELGHFEDGPIEMSYVTLTARAMGIAVEPIDWWRDEDLGASAPDTDADGARRYETEFGSLEQKIESFASFADLNSAERAHDFLRVENARARFGIGYEPGWHRRQSWFHEQARLAIEKHHAGRVAAFVGFEHRPELEMFLAAFGESITAPASLVFSKSPATTVSPQIVAFWREGIARLRAELAVAPESAQAPLKSKIRYWEVAIERSGACCVDEKSL
jgi:hypothetical protein